MSVGLGIHGEPGISDEPCPAPPNSPSSWSPGSCGHARGRRHPGCRLLNGLGTVKYDELFVLFGKVEPLLATAGLRVVEPECGELVTSLDMAGLSLTLLWLDEELEHYWAAPADSPPSARATSPPGPAGPRRPGSCGVRRR